MLKLKLHGVNGGIGWRMLKLKLHGSHVFLAQTNKVEISPSNHDGSSTVYQNVHRRVTSGYS